MSQHWLTSTLGFYQLFSLHTVLLTGTSPALQHRERPRESLVATTGDVDFEEFKGIIERSTGSSAWHKAARAVGAPAALLQAGCASLCLCYSWCCFARAVCEQRESSVE